MLGMDCSSASYGGGIQADGTFLSISHVSAYYQCVDCGFVKHYEQHSEHRSKMVRRLTKYGGWVTEFEPINDSASDKESSVR